MNHSPYRDPLDGPPPKWIRRKSDPPETSEVDWWSHIPDIKRHTNTSSQPLTPSSSKSSTNVSVSNDVREKVTKQTLSQSSISSVPENSDAQKPTTNETFIANQILLLSDIDELYTLCSDPSGVKFQALSAPLIERLSQFIEGETINPDNVLYLLRTTLRITIPKK